jgi:outer membrane protein assembly factor BamB
MHNIRKTLAGITLSFVQIICILNISFTFSCSQEKAPQQQGKMKTAGDWPIFRGSSQLTGLQPGGMPQQPKLLWTFKTEYEIKSSPVIGLNKVFVGSNDGRVYALDINSGKEIWRFETGDDIEAAPLLFNKTLYIGSLNYDFYALDTSNGEIIWKYTTDGEIYGSANFIQSQDPGLSRIIFGSYDNYLYCLDASTGEKKWSYETDNYVNGSPALNDEWIVFGGCDSYVHILSSKDGSNYAKVATNSYIAASSALDAGHVYLGHYGGKVICVNINDKKIDWEFTGDDKKAAFFSSPAVNDKYVVIGSRDHNVYCLDKKNGEIIWKVKTLDDVDSSPVIAGERIVIGSDDGRLYILNVNSGKLIWSYDVGAAITGSPAVGQNIISVGAEDGLIYTFGEKK